MNKEIIKRLAKKSGFLQVYHCMMKWRDEVCSDRFECSVGDILLLRDVPLQNQILLTSRLMDVEAYLRGNDRSFPYQNTISRKAYGDKHREEDGNRSFRALIESYLKDGYHSDSYITCDRDMRLMDGNHRMGLHVYEKIEKINVRRVHRYIPFSYSSDWYFQVGIPTDFMESVFHRFSEIQTWLLETGNTFCMLVKGNNGNERLIQKDMTRLCKVLQVKELQMGGGNSAVFRLSPIVLC